MKKGKISRSSTNEFKMETIKCKADGISFHSMQNNHPHSRAAQIRWQIPRRTQNMTKINGQDEVKISDDLAKDRTKFKNRCWKWSPCEMAPCRVVRHPSIVSSNLQKIHSHCNTCHFEPSHAGVREEQDRQDAQAGSH